MPQIPLAGAECGIATDKMSRNGYTEWRDLMQLHLDADELGPLLVAVLVEPVREREAHRVLGGLFEYRADEGASLAHAPPSGWCIREATGPVECW